MVGELWWFSGDFRSINGMILALRCSEDEEGLFYVMDDILVSRKVMLFISSVLISSMLFSNVVLGSNFSASVLMFIQIYSNSSSKDAGVLERCLFCIINCDETNLGFRLPLQ